MVENGGNSKPIYYYFSKNSVIIFLMSKTGSEKIIMQHILEVRLKKRLFSFMDFRGKMVEYITEKLNTNQIILKNNGSRFDVADDKLENLYFFSVENFGFQIELRTSFEDFSNSVKKMIEAIKDFPEYKISGGVVRIGTKSVILYHRKYDNDEKIKESYKNILVNNHDKISELTNSKIIDTAHIFDLKLDNSKVNVLTGPVTKKEAMEKYFVGKIKGEYDQKFTRDNGMLLAIDASGNNISSINDFNALEKQINTQISDIKIVFESFKSLFNVDEI